MRKKKDPEPDPYLRLVDPDPGGPNHAGPADPDPGDSILYSIPTRFQLGSY